MDDSLVENEDEYMDRDSLSDESFSKDSLLNGHRIEDPQPKSPEHRRRGSYTLETSPEMSSSIRNRHLTQPIYLQTDQSNKCGTNTQKLANKAHKPNMTQSLYERSSVSYGRSNSLMSANAKQREVKLRLAREEQERKQMQKMAVLTESEKIAENVRRRKEIESLKKMEEAKRRAMERQRIVDERRERLNKAEEARRKAILRKLVNSSSKKPSPPSSNSMMTMSCYGGFVSARSKPGNKEVVQNRFLSARPVSSTGKVIGFGSSTPRPICENNSKSNSEHRKIPEAILVKCELLSRPVSSRMSDKMNTSVISPPMSTTGAKKPQRQSSLRENDSSRKVSTKPSSMTTSMIDFAPKIKTKRHTGESRSVLRPDATIKEEMSTSVLHDKSRAEPKRTIAPENGHSSSLTNTSKRSEESSLNRKAVASKSDTFPRRIRRKKVDIHLDSDSIEEEVVVIQRPNKLPQSTMADSVDSVPRVRIMESTKNTKIEDVKSQSEVVKGSPTKDLSEAEYKARLMENRRLAREKREREREQLMKSERDRRHADEMAVRELMEIERDKMNYVEETICTTSNEDTLDVPNKQNTEMEGDTECQLSEIAEIPSVVCNDEPEETVNKHNLEKNQRKKHLDSIMSRIRKTNDESSSEGGISPRRAMSPEPAELEPDVNIISSAPAFRSTLLQSMMNKGRLSKIQSPNKDGKEEDAVIEDNMANVPSLTGATLSSVRESVEDYTESQSTNANSLSSTAIHSPGLEGNSLSERNSEFVPEVSAETRESNSELSKEKIGTPTYSTPSIGREDCDGKEDSLSQNEHPVNNSLPKIDKMTLLKNAANSSSVSSAETEEEEIIKAPFEM